MKLSKIVISIFILFLTIIIFAQSANFEDKIKVNEEKLSNIKSQLEKVKKEKHNIDMQKSKTFLILNRMDEEIYLTDLLISELQKKDSLLNIKIRKLEQEIDSLDKELIKRKNILAMRIRDMYKKGKIHTFEILFTSKSFSQLSQRVKYLGIIAQQDKKLYEKVKVLKELLDNRKEQYKINKEQLKQVKDEAEKEKINLEIEKENKQKFLKILSLKQKEQSKLENELKQAKESLQYLINKLRIANKKITKNRNVKEGQHYFDKNKKKVIWPAKGTVISKFGKVRHPKYGTKTINNGIDIKVKLGDPVFCVYDGDVIYADKFLGYGNVIMIDHGNGYYTLYAHLQEMNVVLNQPILQGEKIGTCGETGSLSGPILHFEIRKDGKPLNPLNYLK